jgi:hypothetical protein
MHSCRQTSAQVIAPKGDQGQIGLADTNIAPQVVELQQLYAEARR